eukprot:16427453-Heterocapsa_arctica.AAC.1
MQDQQHIAETENGNQDEVRAQEEHHFEDDTADAQIMGEQSDNEHKIAEVEQVEHNGEQLFKEGQANKAIQKQEALRQKLQHKANKELRTLGEGDNSSQKVDDNCHLVEDKQTHINMHSLSRARGRYNQ